MDQKDSGTPENDSSRSLDHFLPGALQVAVETHLSVKWQEMIEDLTTAQRTELTPADEAMAGDDGFGPDGPTAFLLA